MKKLFTWSNLVKAIEYLVYVCPTLGTVLYYYFDEIQTKVSTSSKYSFALALVLLVLFVIFKAMTKKKVDELRQSVVQTETDLKNTPTSDTAKIEILTANATKDRQKLKVYDNGVIVLALLVLALAVNILEKALIGLTNLCLIGVGSVACGLGLDLVSLELKKKGK